MFESGALRANTFNQYTATQKRPWVACASPSQHLAGEHRAQVLAGKSRFSQLVCSAHGGAVGRLQTGWQQHATHGFVSSYVQNPESRILMDRPLWVCIALKSRTGAAFCLKSSARLSRLNTITCSMSSLDYGDHETGKGSGGMQIIANHVLREAFAERGGPPRAMNAWHRFCGTTSFACGLG